VLWSVRSKRLASAPVGWGFASLVLGAGVWLSLSPFVLTGYTGVRYFVPVFVVVCWVVLGFASKLRPALCAGLCAVVLCGVVPRVWGDAPSGVPNADDPIALACLSGTGVALVADATLASRLSALHGRTTGFLPRNLLLGSNDDVAEQAFIDRYGVYVLIDLKNTVPATSPIGLLPRCR